jgi:glycosyltransferase involved in cell wall biosynthesis
MNILMINTVNGGGGAGRGSARLAEALQAAGHRVNAIVGGVTGSDVVGRRYGWWRDDAIAKYLRALGIEDCGRLSSFGWRFLAEYAEADVIHLHNLHGDYLSMLALPIWGWDKPLVWTLHDQWAVTGGCINSFGCDRYRQSCGRCPQVGGYAVGARDRTRLMKGLKNWLFKRARPRLITPSRWLANLVPHSRALRNCPKTVIPHTLATDIFRPAHDVGAARARFGLADDRPTAVFVCQSFNNRFKGAADAAAAVRHARGRVPELQVLALGNDSQRFLAEAGADGRAESFLENQADVAAAFAAADVSIMPSYGDNYPFVVMESLSCGTPVVGYAVGGIPEQVAQGERGLLVPPGDRVGLGAALAELLSEPGRAAAMGAAGRRFVQRTVDPAAVAGRHIAEYEAAISAWRQRHGRAHARWARGRLSRAVARRLGWEVAPDSDNRSAPGRQQEAGADLSAAALQCELSAADSS